MRIALVNGGHQMEAEALLRSESPRLDGHPVVRLTIDGIGQDARQDERLVDVITRIGGSVPHVCYHPQLGSIQTCDTCMVEVNGQLARACATGVVDGMVISTASAKA